MTRETTDTTCASTDNSGGGVPAGKPCCAPPVVVKEQCCPPSTEGEQDCCSPTVTAEPCCPPKDEHRRVGYRLEGFVEDWVETTIGRVPLVKRTLNTNDHLGRLAMRWGIGRDHYTVTPGLYAIGKPHAQSEVLISANYKLSFDLLRSSLQ
ncbi:MAG: hypothetical protein L3J63_08705, partial [Geopsychrobacter sp.]|nr:hypothetical protein [Geopsychrobacter sp.]